MAVPSQSVAKSMTSLIPGRWATPLLAKFFGIAPWNFLLMAVLQVSSRFLGLASFIIPLKLLFLASQGVTEVGIPWTDITFKLGRVEVTAIVIPFGALSLLNRYVRKEGDNRKLYLTEMVGNNPNIAEKAQKRFRKILNRFSGMFSNLLLASSCVGVMSIFVPDVAGILVGCVVAALFISRYRITAFYAKQDALNARGEGLSKQEIEERVNRISSNTQIGLQMVMLPAFVYLVSGALIEGELDAIGAMAFLFMFRWFLRAGQAFTSGLTRFLHSLSSERELQAAVASGVLRS